MIVYRGFAVRDDNRVYRAGPVLELAAHSQSQVSALRVAALPHLQRLTNLLGGRYASRPAERPDLPDLPALRDELARIRRNGFAVNSERSERGLVAVGVVVHGADGTALAGLSVSMPAVRYDPHRLESLVATLSAASRTLEAALAAPSAGRPDGSAVTSRSDETRTDADLDA